MDILIVGLGLIGGSLCRALSTYTEHNIYGYDKNEEVIQKAINDGNISKDLQSDEFSIADMIIIALHPTATRIFIEENISKFKAGSIITDVCGIKGKFVTDMTELAIRNNVQYVGTHPMAGKEKFGYDNSDANLFQGANFIITPTDVTNFIAVDAIVKLAKQIGFSNIIYTDPFEHDRIIAYTSQLAHIVSSAYVKSPTLYKENGFSGGSFSDMTRIATLNEDMWTSLFMINKYPLLKELDCLIDNLIKYREAIFNDDCKELTQLLREGRILKEKNLNNKRTNK